MLLIKNGLLTSYHSMLLLLLYLYMCLPTCQPVYLVPIIHPPPLTPSHPLTHPHPLTPSHPSPTHPIHNLLLSLTHLFSHLLSTSSPIHPSSPPSPPSPTHVLSLSLSYSKDKKKQIQRTQQKRDDLPSFPFLPCIKLKKQEDVRSKK